MKALEITTKIGCLNCDYCPQSKLLAAYKSIEREISCIKFGKFIDKIPKKVDIHFSGFGEPFLNGNCSVFIFEALNEGHKISVFTTLMGIDNEIAIQLSKIKFKQFVVHVPDNYTHFNVKQWTENINLLIKHKIKFKLLYVNDGQKTTVPFWRDKYIDQPLTTRAGNCKKNNINLKGAIDCDGKRYNQNVLLPNGAVVLCCMDYGLEYKLGNLLTDDYESLFKSENYLKIKNGLKDNSYDILCRHCERAYRI
jgi:radical SAM protein with 4Fe4S-binding SPASM domain